MKNLLSENMIRFGTKNLSESAQKELIVKSIMQTINEHGLQSAVRRSLLTEQTDVDLMTDPLAPAALKSLNSQYTQGTKLPAVRMGHYYLKSAALTTTTPDSTDPMVQGQVGRLFGKGIGGVGSIPVPANTVLGEGGDMEWGPGKYPKWYKLNFDSAKRLALPAGTAAEIAANINAACALYPAAELTAMLAADPKKAAYDTAITAFKASTSAIKPLLTGNAKAFYGIG